MPRRRVEVVIDFNIGNITLPDGPLDLSGLLTPPGGGGGGGGGTGGGGGGGGNNNPDWQDRLSRILGPRLGRQVSGNITWIRNLIGEIGGLGEIAAWVLVPLAGLVVTLYSVYKVSQVCWTVMVRLGQALGRLLVAGFRLALDWAKRFAEGTARLVVATLQGIVTWAERAATSLYRLAVNGLRSAIDYFAEFQQEAATTVTVMGQYGEAAVKARAEVMAFSEDVSARSRYSSKEVAQAMYEMHSAGFSAMEDVKALTEASLNLATATQSDVKPAMELMGSTINTFKLRASDATTVADIFFNAVAQSPARMDKLIESMRYAGPIASTLGMSLKETVAELEAFYTRGISASMAGTLFRQALNGLMRTSDKAKAAFHEAGADLSKFDPAKAGGLIPVIEQFEQLERQIGKTKVRELIFKAFEMRAAFGITVLLDTGSAKLKRFEAGLGQTGTAAQAASDQMNTLSGAWARVLHMVQNVGTELLSGGVGKALQTFLDWLGEVIKYEKTLGLFQAIGFALQFVVNTLIWGIAQVGGSATGTLFSLAYSVGYILRLFAYGVQQAVPYVQAFVQWLPQLAWQIAGGLVPALLNLAVTALPLLFRLVEMGLPLAVNILWALVNAVQALLNQGGQTLVQLILNWYGAVLQLVNLLPTVIPLLVWLLFLMLQGPQNMVNLVQTVLPLVVRAIVFVVLLVQRLISEIRAAATEWLPRLYQWFVATWNASRPVLLWCLDVFHSWFGLLEGLANMLPIIVSFLWELSIPLAVLEAVGVTLLAIFGGIYWIIEKILEGAAEIAEMLGMDLVAKVLKGAADMYKGGEQFADNAAKMGADILKAWWAAPGAAAAVAPTAAKAAHMGGQATATASEAVRNWNPPPMPPAWTPQGPATTNTSGTAGGNGAGYWGPQPAGAGAGAMGAENINVNLAVPPNWDMLKVAFGQWADQQKAQEAMRQRVGGPGSGGPSAGSYAPAPGQPSANGSHRRFGGPS